MGAEASSLPLKLLVKFPQSPRPSLSQKLYMFVLVRRLKAVSKHLPPSLPLCSPHFAHLFQINSAASFHRPGSSRSTPYEILRKTWGQGCSRATPDNTVPWPATEPIYKLMWALSSPRYPWALINELWAHTLSVSFHYYGLWVIHYSWALTALSSYIIHELLYELWVIHYSWALSSELIHYSWAPHTAPAYP